MSNQPDSANAAVAALPLAPCSVRPAFEEWITAAPMEKDVTRNPTDERKSAWPGQYCSYEVQLAWEAWCAALESTDCIAEYAGKANRRDWWSGGAWLYPGDRVAIVSSPNTQGLVTPGTGLSPEEGASSRRHQ